MSGRRRSSRKRLPSSEESFVPPETSSLPADLGQEQSSGSQPSIEQQDGEVSNTFDKANSNLQSMVLRSRCRITPNNSFAPEHEESLSSDAESFRQGLRYRKTTRDSPSTGNATGGEYRGDSSGYSPFRPGSIPQPHEVAAIARRWGPRRYEEDVEFDIVDRERQRATSTKAGVSFGTWQSSHTTHQEPADRGMIYESRSYHTSPFQSHQEEAPAASSRGTEEAPVGPPVQNTPRPWNTRLNRAVAFCRALFSGPYKLQIICFVAFILLDMVIALFFNVSLAIHGPISLRPEPLLNIEKQVDIIEFYTKEQPPAGTIGYRGPNLLHHFERNRVAVEFCEVVRHEWHSAWVKELLDEQSVCYQPDLPLELFGEAQESQFYEPEEESDWRNEWSAYMNRTFFPEIAPPSNECAKRLLPYAMPGINVSQMIELDEECRWYSPRYLKITQQFMNFLQLSSASASSALHDIRRELDGAPSQRDTGKDIKKRRKQLAGRDGYNLLTAFNFMEEYPLPDGDLIESDKLRESDDEFHSKKQRAKERGNSWFKKANETRSSKRYVRKNAKAMERQIRMWHRHRLGRFLQMQMEVGLLTETFGWLGRAFWMLDSGQDDLGRPMEIAILFCAHSTTGNHRWSSVCDVNLAMFLDKASDRQDREAASRMLQEMHNATLRIQAPFESLDSQRCAVSSLYALLEGINDKPSHALEVAMSPSGRINLGYATASAAEPLGGMLLRLTPQSNFWIFESKEILFPECGAVSPWQNAKKALHNDDDARAREYGGPVTGRYNPKRTSWAWIALRTYGKLRALFFSFVPVPQWWSNLWRAYSLFGWPDIDQVVQRMPDRRAWMEDEPYYSERRGTYDTAL